MSSSGQCNPTVRLLLLSPSNYFNFPQHLYLIPSRASQDQLPVAMVIDDRPVKTVAYSQSAIKHLLPLRSLGELTATEIQFLGNNSVPSGPPDFTWQKVDSCLEITLPNSSFHFYRIPEDALSILVGAHSSFLPVSLNCLSPLTHLNIEMVAQSLSPGRVLGNGARCNRWKIDQGSPCMEWTIEPAHPRTVPRIHFRQNGSSLQSPATRKYG